MMLRDHDKNREPISIHALREEGDYSFDWCFSSRK